MVLRARGRPGHRLAEHVLGPHSLASFAIEWRPYRMTIWGATA